jgi:hypothetical protein
MAAVIGDVKDKPTLEETNRISAQNGRLLVLFAGSLACHSLHEDLKGSFFS